MIYRREKPKLRESILRICDLYGFSLVLNGFKRHVENQNKEGFNSFNGFNKIYERINEKRKRDGLNELDFFCESHTFVKNFCVNSHFVENQKTVKTSLLAVLNTPFKTKLKPEQISGDTLCLNSDKPSKVDTKKEDNCFFGNLDRDALLKQIEDVMSEHPKTDWKINDIAGRLGFASLNRRKEINDVLLDVCSDPSSKTRIVQVDRSGLIFRLRGV